MNVGELVRRLVPPPSGERVRVGWWIVNLLGTCLFVYTLASARPTPDIAVFVWTGYGLCMALWISFIVLERRRPRLAIALLAGCSLLACVLSAVPQSNETTIVAMVTLVICASSSSISVVAIVSIGVLDALAFTASGWTNDQPVGWFASNLGAAALVLMLGLIRRQGRVQAQQTEELLRQTQLAQQEHARAAALDERTRIAREIHDVLAHSLGALGVQLEVAEAQLDKGDVAGASERVRRARRLAASGLVEARDAVNALRQDVPSLEAALAELIEDHDLEARLRTDGASRALSSAATVSLLRTAREALTNASRHAPGAPVSVVLTYTPSAVRLAVRNEAASRPVVAEPSGGFGLTGMRERIALAGGTLTAGRSGEGWEVVAEVPE
ncbi:sensor histidine kinase [Tenggerimyces flavus]|uniref:histidine kinase n=1 Tax=Tenggerimyces flavus TaxID=1708749 RepID=A0ABV7YQK1_9ACTN|nr:histidine kinase [Tenggerimyces flavus]MBM7784390.1 signal transduction histidine kinase [Tenggerimyces flavus]